MEILAEGKRIVVSDGSARWQPESGQILIEFEERAVGRLLPLRPGEGRGEVAAKATDAETWYQRGCELEATDAEAAREAYRRAVSLDPSHADAHVNMGRLLHEAGDASAAEEHYRSALEARPNDATAAFDLGVALEDLGRDIEAIDAYETAVALDPEHADAYFNLAGACERVGRPTAAIGHLKAYRALIRSRSQ
jgi:tetratricopeptide (TPR) repeat protein